MPWLKVWRDTSAHAGRPHYAQYENEDDIKLLLNYFDERIHDDGRGHDLKYEKIDKPPKEWLVKEIAHYRERLGSLYKEYKQNKINLFNIIREYKTLLKTY